jgi:hypothetical protein
VHRRGKAAPPVSGRRCRSVFCLNCGGGIKTGLVFTVPAPPRYLPETNTYLLSEKDILKKIY